MIVSGELLNQKIYALPEPRLVYLSNAKVGCSTVKGSLWKGVSPSTFNPELASHNRSGSPFLVNISQISRDLAGFSESTFFTMVRNPYSRVISAYLDKVMRETRDFSVWGKICNRFNFSVSDRPSLGDFLTCLIDEDPEFIDQHFAPQYVNTLFDYVECDFVGRLENMQGMADFLSAYDIEIESFLKHSTSANQKTSELLGAREIKLIQQIYARDFEVFGYSEDPEQTEAVGPVESTGIGKERLILLLRGLTSRTRDERHGALDELSELLPEHSILYNKLELGGIGVAEMPVLVSDIESGKVANWRIITKTAELLLRQNNVTDARSILDKAIALM